jgi:polyketide biosynthesis enoyl-CoA hydratase PksH
MGIINEMGPYENIRVRFDETICYLQLYRPGSNNTINAQLIEECRQVLNHCESFCTIVVLEGLPEVFCFGADFQEMQESDLDPQPLYELWLQLANGPYVTIANVRGKVNAGGVGFVAACDIVLCEEQAVFSLSELLFGLMPACVLPFLIRRVGYSKAHYMTLMTQPVSAQLAYEWGLVNALGSKSDDLLRRHLLRLKCLSKKAISRYKLYMNSLNDTVGAAWPKAQAANKMVFSDSENIEKITRYVKTGQFPWED